MKQWPASLKQVEMCQNFRQASRENQVPGFHPAAREMQNNCPAMAFCSAISNLFLKALEVAWPIASSSGQWVRDAKKPWQPLHHFGKKNTHHSQFLLQKAIICSSKSYIRILKRMDPGKTGCPHHKKKKFWLSCRWASCASVKSWGILSLCKQIRMHCQAWDQLQIPRYQVDGILSKSAPAICILFCHLNLHKYNVCSSMFVKKKKKPVYCIYLNQRLVARMLILAFFGNSSVFWVAHHPLPFFWGALGSTALCGVIVCVGIPRSQQVRSRKMSRFCLITCQLGSSKTRAKNAQNARKEENMRK